MLNNKSPIYILVEGQAPTKEFDDASCKSSSTDYKGDSLRGARMPVKKAISLVITLLAAIAFLFLSIERGRAQNDGSSMQTQSREARRLNAQTTSNSEAMIEEGRETFRFDTFGDEAFWGGTLGLHNAIKGAALGGVGPGLSPSVALSLGLKVDLD